MPLKDAVKISRKTFINPRGWLGYDQLKTNTSAIWSLLKNVFSVDKPERTETFAEAVERLNLSEADIQRTQQNYLAYSYFFLFIAFLTIGGSFYLLIADLSIAGFILGLATAALFGSQWFRYSFWLFQMKHRKLGCTFAEWRRGKPFDEKGPQP